MNWIDVVWIGIGAAAVTLGVIHLFVWMRSRREWASLLFAATAVSVASVSMIELALLRTADAADFGEFVRWAHLPTFVIVVAMVWFVRLRFDAGSLALAWFVTLGRAACLLPNFLSGANLNYEAVHWVDRMTLWGDAISIPGAAEPNPWMLLGTFNVLALAAFIVSALLQLWRRPQSGERTRAIVVCLAMTAFALASGGWIWLVVHEYVRGPLMFSPAFLGVMLAMGYEIGGGLARADQLEQNLTVAERDLRDSERRMNHAVQAAGVGLWNWDIAGNRMWLSPQACVLLGGDPARGLDVEGFLSCLHPDDRGRFGDALRRASNGTGEFRSEFRVVRSHDQRWLAARGQVIGDESREMVRLDGVLVDVTERKDSELRFRRLVEVAPNALLIVDPRGRVVLANGEAGRIFGCDAGELAGEAVAALLPPDAVPAADMAAVVPAAGAIGKGREVSGRRRDGSVFPLLVASSPVPFESELAVLLSLTDLSEKRRAEQEAALQRDELAHLSRVALLTELSGSLAHEINQPLAAILANAQAANRFLDRTSPDLGEVRDSLAAIVESDKRATEVIRRMRALLRKDSSSYRRFEVNEVAEDVLRLLHSDLLGRHVRVERELAVALPPVLGDAIQIQQVLLNLVMNACDAVAQQAGPGRVLVRTSLAGDGRVEVAVVDNGCGIAPDRLKEIFAPFVTSKRDGLGLGLAVCSTIIQAHAGEIAAENNVSGPGATVRFRLPVPAGEAEGIDASVPGRQG